MDTYLYMDDVKKLSWVALSAIHGIGTGSILALETALTKHELDWAEFWVMSEATLSKCGLTQTLIDRVHSFKKEHSIYSYAQKLKAANIDAVIKGESAYPSVLSRSPHSPQVLFRKGSPQEWQQPCVAVVGTRKMTAYGHFVTTKITTELSRLGANIVSGGMYGVDMAAHTASLEAGGNTVAVLGYGFEFCYPAAHVALYQEMLEKGATFFTPFAPHVAPHKGLFVARNRVVAGMSQAVVVTEAAEKSGTHITAGYAADEGKVVCAVPGPITNPYSEGTKWLINQGAVLVQSGLEVMRECGASITVGSLDEASPAYRSTSSVLSALATGSFSTDELVNNLQLHYTFLTTELSSLELDGKIKKEGGRWCLTK